MERKGEHAAAVDAMLQANGGAMRDGDTTEERWADSTTTGERRVATGEAATE